MKAYYLVSNFENGKLKEPWIIEKELVDIFDVDYIYLWCSETKEDCEDTKNLCWPLFDKLNVKRDNKKIKQLEHICKMTESRLKEKCKANQVYPENFDLDNDLPF